jgi:hypothetical protein
MFKRYEYTLRGAGRGLFWASRRNFGIDIRCVSYYIVKTGCECGGNAAFERHAHVTFF